jgi:hypothetical protein
VVNTLTHGNISYLARRAARATHTTPKMCGVCVRKTISKKKSKNKNSFRNGLFPKKEKKEG